MTAEDTRRTVGEAVEVLPADAPRDVWLAHRRAGIGGSDASVIAGVNRYRTRYDLWVDKTSEDEDDVDVDSPAMRWGRLLEPALVRAFVEDTGIGVRPCGLLAHRERGWQRYTPDGLTDDGGLFEAKTTGSLTGGREWDDGAVADHAEVQVQHGMAVTGLPHAWVVVLIDGRDFRLRRVERDDGLIATLTRLEEAFWGGHVIPRVPPPYDAGDLPGVKAAHPRAVPESVLDGDEADVDLVADVRETRAVVREATAARDRAEAALLARLGDNEALSVFGAVLATAKTSTTTRLDTRAIRAAHPDLVAPYLTARDSRTLRLRD